jgi:5-methylcytosine-specific restriction protein A
MPWKPKKPCARQGCPNLTTAHYCESCARAESRRYEQQQRDPGHDARYGANWRRVRAACLAAHPLCQLCQQEGRLTPATLVHHKVKLTDGGDNSPENLVACCQECHSRLHAQQGDSWSSRKGNARVHP